MAILNATLTELTLNTASADLPASGWDAISDGTLGFSLDMTGVGSPVVLGQGNLTITMAASDVKYVVLESGRFEQDDSTIKGTVAANATKMIAFLLPVNWG